MKYKTITFLSLYIVANVLLSEVLVDSTLFGLYCKWFGCGGGGLGYPVYCYGRSYYGGFYGVYPWRGWRRRWGHGGWVQPLGYGCGGGSNVHRSHKRHRGK